MTTPALPQRSTDGGPTGPDPHSHADRAASFDRDADVYAQVRPGYPREALAWLLPAGARRVLDLAAGTGKLTAAAVAVLGEREGDEPVDVVAVDPSAAMLAELSARIPGVATHRGTAESIPLPDASVDAVLVGQAWHWFDPEAASAEISRVLRPGGILGVLWNIRDDSVDWVAQFGAIIHGGDRLTPVEDRPRLPDLGAGFTAPESREVGWVDRIPTAHLRTLAGTRSYLLSLPEDERERLLTQVDTLVASHPALAGRAEAGLPYVTHAFRARRS